MKKSRRYAFAGVMTAVSVILLAAGSVVWIFAYTMPLLCGLINALTARSFGKKTAWLIYIAVSVLALFLLSDKESALLYVLFCGFYPMLREGMARLKKWLQLPLKLLIFNAGIVAAELLCIYVFMIPFDNFLGKWGAVLLLALGNLVFLFYDRLLDILFIIYDKKYRARLENLLK